MILPVLLAASASAFHLHQESPLLDFEYRWPSQAAAIPALRRRLAAQMQHDRYRYLTMAKKDRAERQARDFPFMRYSFSRVLHFAGRTRRLIAFADERNAFTGGAHGNPSTQSLLWDLAGNKTLAFTDLFSRSPGPMIQPSYCRGLTAQRKRKMGSEPFSNIWDACPDPLKLSVIPEDKDRDGRFETINVTANPYDVGSYAEGYYIVMLPVTQPLFNALKPQFRQSFEVQRQ